MTTLIERDGWRTSKIRRDGVELLRVVHATIPLPDGTVPVHCHGDGISRRCGPTRVRDGWLVADIPMSELESAA